jgi:hypothetical protein
MFTGIYNDMTIDFIYGNLNVGNTSCALDLYFIHQASGDTLNFYLADLPYNNGLPEDTYQFDEQGTFSVGIAGDCGHGKYFAESGTLIIEHDGNLYKAVLELDGTAHGSSSGPAKAVGYFKGTLNIN